MTYDPTQPTGDDMATTRENFRALKEDAIVNAGTLNSLTQGNASGNIPVSNGTLNANLNADLLDGQEGSYYAAASSIPTKTSELTNDSGFLTSETEPAFNASPAKNITSSEVTILSNTSGVNTGDQVIPTKVSDLTNDSGFLTSETDPVFTASPAYNITSSEVTVLGNTSGVNTGDQVIPTKVSDLTNDSGFLTSETDPVFTASPAYNITSSEVTVLGNTSGVNTGDETDSTIKTKLGITTLNGLLKADGSGNISAATAGTDYLTPTGSAAGLTGLTSTQVTSALGYTPSSEAVTPNVIQGRLTLTSGTPITTSDVTSASTIYFTPLDGNKITLYNGSAWQTVAFSEVSLALSALTAGLPYDVFGYLSSGSLQLELLAWSSASARATALTTLDGIYVKSGDSTRLYLGSFYTTSTTTTEDSENKRLLWNMYNKIEKPLLRNETVSTWGCSTIGWLQANSNSLNKVSIMCGLSQNIITLECVGQSSVTSSSSYICEVGIGVDSASVNSAKVFAGQSNSKSLASIRGHYAFYKAFPTAGYHYYTWLQYQTLATNITWLGTAGTDGYGITGLDGTCYC
jgi:hypothetical protein